MPSLIRTPKEEGHYTIKRVDRLPPRGNMNWLYTFRTPTLEKFYRWTVDGEYEEITVGGAGSSITNTSELVNDGASGTSTYVELSGISVVGISGDYNDLINAPANVIESIVAGTNVTVDNTDPANPIINATGSGGGGITSVVGSSNIGVDNTDPNNPVVSAVNLVTTDTTQTVSGQKTWTNLNTFNSSVDIRSGNLFVEDVYLNPHTPFGGTLSGRVDFGVDSTYRVYFHPEGGTSNAFLNFNGISADREYMFQDGSGTLAFLTDIPSSVTSIDGGANISIDNTNPNIPIVSAVDVVNTTSTQAINGNKTFNGTLTAASFLQVNATNPAQNIFLLYPIGSLGGTTLVGGASSYLITAPDGSMVWRGTANPDMVFSNQNVTERRTYTLQDGDGTLAFLSDIPSPGVQSIVAGTNVTVDNTDPLNPIVSSAGGAGISSVVAGADIDVDNTDPANPVVSVDGTETPSFPTITTVFNDLFTGVPGFVSLTTYNVGRIVYYEGFFGVNRNALVGGTDYTAIFELTVPLAVATSGRSQGNARVDGISGSQNTQVFCEVDNTETLNITVRIFDAIGTGAGTATIYFSGTYLTS